MFNKIKEFFFGKPQTVEAKVEAPYKVEAPTQAPTLTVVTADSPATTPTKKPRAPAKPKVVKTSTPKAKKPRVTKTK